MSSIAKKANADLNLNGQTALLSGFTQGIGLGVAQRLCQAGANLILIGRNKDTADRIIADLKQKARVPEQTFQFVQADLSLKDDMKRAVEEVVSKAPNGQVDYFIQTQGMTPNGKWMAETKDGLEGRFAIQVLSKFGLLYWLTKKNVIKTSAVSICSPGGNTKDFDGNDPELRKLKESGKYGLIKSAERDGLCVDAITIECNEKFGPVKYFHVFPGYVDTQAVSNAGFPAPVQWLAKLAAPVLSRTIGNSVESYAEIPVYIATKPEAQTSQYLNASLAAVEPNTWTAIPENRKTLWTALASHLGISE